LETIENIYDNLGKIQSRKIKDILIKEKENVFISKKLATIKTDMQINLDIEKLKFTGFNKKLRSFLESYQMDSLIRRIFSEKIPEKKVENKKESDQIGLF